jgi:hypothetical protein
MAKKIETTNEVPVNDKERKPTVKKTFSLDDFKKENKLDKSVKFKPVKWLPIRNVLGNRSFCNATGLKGIPANEVVSIIGHTDSGKTLLLNEIAYSCQQDGILPVFIITELKFSWEHLKTMGFKFTEEIDEETGEITYSGDFLFIDRSQFDTIEQMVEKMHNILDFQKNGKLPRDLCFLIDSIGTIQCELSKSSNKSNNEWDAGSIARTFSKGLIPRINLSKKDNYPYDNYMVIISQVWVRKPDSPVGMPKLAAKGGDTIPFNSTLQIVFGNVTNSGTSKLKISKNGKDVVYASRSKVSVAKNHITGISLTAKIVSTPHGFVEDSVKDVAAKQYFKDHSKIFMDLLGGDDIDNISFSEDNSEENEYSLRNYKIIPETDEVDSD